MPRLIPGRNDLATLCPEIAAEWHPTKNEGLTPSAVTFKSNKSVIWICKKGHEWTASINNRSSFHHHCPYCSGNKAIPGETDLATVNPKLAAEWHPTKNGDLSPSQVMVGSYKQVWWLGKCGHEWKAVINNRAHGTGCPICSRKNRIHVRTNKQVLYRGSLLEKNPSLAAEWHPTLNGKLTPEMVTIKSGKNVWWKCSEGHEWKATISNRSNGRGCPYCSGRNVISGETDLVTVNPCLASEWHPTKNGTLTPGEVTYGSGKKVWWLGKCGHEWEAVISSRNSGSGCPYCSGRRAIPGETDLVTVNPCLASEWHPTKNGTVNYPSAKAKGLLER